MKGHYIGSLIDLLADRGVDRAAFLRDCGIDESELSPDTLIDPDRVLLTTRLAVEQTQDPGIGLYAGQRLNINTHGSLGYAAMASADYYQALKLLVRYYKVQAPRAFFELREQGGRLYLLCESSFEAPQMPRMTTEFLVSSIYTSTRFLLCGRMQGVEVAFRHPLPDYLAEYQEVFDVPVRFDQPLNGLIIPDSVARLPLPSADPATARIFEKRCELEWRTQDHPLLSERIREWQLRRPGAFLSQSEVAERLGLSVSTLHRKLAEEDVTFKGLMVEIRKTMALEYLRDGSLTVDEIAALLGFSDASNFRRAFVNWTGQTPRQARES